MSSKVIWASALAGLVLLVAGNVSAQLVPMSVWRLIGQSISPSISSWSAGVGTTSPNAKLAVQGTAGDGDVFNVASSTGASLLKVAYDGNVTLGDLTISGTCTGCSGSSGIGDLTDVTITAAGYGDVLMYGGSAWNDTATSTLFGQNLTIAGSPSFVALTANDAAATSTFAGGLTVDTSDFVVDPDAGRVGIGTASPGSLLHVNGTSEFEGILNTNGNWISGDGGAEGISINSTGNVGIGMVSPDSVLHVKSSTPGTVGDKPAGQLILQNPTNDVNANAIITGYKSDGNGDPDEQLWYLGSSSGSNSNITFLNRKNASLFLGTNDATQLTILGSGYVGIASSTPWGKLSVSGGAIVADAYMVSTSTNMTIDWRDGNQQTVRIGTAATTISHSGYIPGQALVLEVCNPGATASTITWNGVLWPAATAPTHTTTADKCDMYVFRAGAGTSTPIIYGGFNQDY